MLPNQYDWRTKNTHANEDIIETILKNRGIDNKEEIERFLNPSKEGLHDPFLMTYMEEATTRILLAREQLESVVIYGDYDVDGVTSTSILYMFLKEIGVNVRYYIPNRQTEGYGLNKEAVEKLAKEVTLLITVDTGIAAIEEVAVGKSLGLDMIITDHHECQSQLPDAFCILNPKLPGNSYPFDSLAGVGVTFKLIQGLARKLNIEEQIWKYLDITALGTVADVVTLEGENRLITSLGFKEMAHTTHIGLRALLEVIPNKDKKITSNLIGYQVGPRINAAGRISDAKIGVELLTTKNAEKAKSIATLLDEENKKRQQMESEILEEAQRYIDEKIDIEKEKVIIVAGENWHHGVIGIVASRVMNKYYKPTIILTLEDGIYSGSARSIEGFNIFEAINAQKEHLVRFGGHEMAAGLSLEENQLEAFRKALNTYADPLLTPEILTPSLDIDMEVDIKDLTLGLYDRLEKLEPFGTGNPVPLFAMRGRLQFANAIGDGSHLKLVLWQDGVVLSAVAFGKGYLAEYLSEGEEVKIAGEITKNIWNNKISLQLRLKDITSTETKVRKSKYYLSLYQAMPEPTIVSLEEVHFQPSPITQGNSIAVYTESGLEQLSQIVARPKNTFTYPNRICYNEMYDASGERYIIVNPTQKEGNYLPFDWNFKDTGNYACIEEGLHTHKEQVHKMVPTYVDCKVIYRLLKENKKGYLYLHKIVEVLNAYNMTEYKVLQGLDIFKELGLIVYEYVEERIVYQLISGKKTQLQDSKRYQLLQHFLALYTSPKI